ncbi:MAG: trans-2-enoyl-CoA reductase family protein [Candidatus Poribacteria bacterium]|nr:trans-2-enoyl-CoA reductase family protein [Candidatus Poribacteria bacterium]
MAVQVLKPRIRGFICTNAHPIGCHQNVQNQVNYIRKNVKMKQTDLNVLVVGASAGYGLASRIALTWAYGAKTIGIFYERPADARRTATAGLYNAAAFHQLAQQDGYVAESINSDAFSDDVKRDAIDRIKRLMGKIDLLVYSIAAPRRIHPRTGAEHHSVLKPIGESYTGRTIDLNRGTITEVTLEPANETEVADTVAVMGGEDLEFWVDALFAENLLAQGSKVVAYSYIGPEVTWPIYRSGAIGKAKEDLEHRINNLDGRLATELGGHAYLSINKAIISQASMAIPVVPLYMSILNDIMDAEGVNEDPIAQMARLFTAHLGPDQTPTLDPARRIRLDDLELRLDITAAVMDRWGRIHTDNFRDLSDYDGLKRGFRNLFGFEVDGVDYDEAVETEVSLP